MDSPFQICLVGAQGVGKSALVCRLINGEFVLDDDPTVEDNYDQSIVCDGRECTLSILDCGGESEYYQSLHRKWFARAEGFIVMYSICSKYSFSSLASYLHDIQKVKQIPVEDIPKVIVGTKADEAEEREVTTNDGMKLAEQFNAKFVEVSAKTGEGVIDVFRELVRDLRRARDENKHPQVTKKKSKRAQLFYSLSKSSNMRPPHTHGDSKKAVSLGPKSGQSMTFPIASSLEDIWTSKPHPRREWEEVEVPEKDVPSAIATLIESKCRENGHHIEHGRKKVIYASKDVLIEESENDNPWYKLFFAGRDHKNLYAEDETVGPVIVSMESPGKGIPKKAIVRQKAGNDRILIPASFSGSRKEQIQYIQTILPQLSNLKFREASDPSVETDLIEFERKEVVRKYKFGVLYMRENQKTEDEMFSNNDPSPEFMEFMECLGQKVQLKGFERYTGGLDIKRDATGTESIFTEHHGMEIMFHVSTMLPFQDADLQRIERKRHIGNDVVVIIFKEGKQAFDPRIIKSHFNHNFFVVSVYKKSKSKYKYKMAIVNHPGVAPYGPFLPSPAVFERGDSFREFFLTKLINAERSSLHGGQFVERIVRGRNSILKSMIQHFNENAPGRWSSVSSPQVPMKKAAINNPSTMKAKSPTVQDNLAEVVDLAANLLTASAEQPFNNDKFQELLNKFVPSAKTLLTGTTKENMIPESSVIFQLGIVFAKLRCQGEPKDANEFPGRMTAFHVFLMNLNNSELKKTRNLSPAIFRQKTTTLNCFLREKKQVEVAINPQLEDLKLKISKKFGEPDLIMRYQTPMGLLKVISTQVELDEAVADGLRDIFLHQEGKRNDFIDPVVLKEEHKLAFLQGVELLDLDTVTNMGDKAPALIDTKDEEGRTPLHIAALSGFVPMVKYFVEKNCDVNATDLKGWTPLHAAACSSNPYASLFLLRIPNVQVTIPNEDQNTPLHYLAKHPFDSGHPRALEEIVSILLQKGVDVNALNKRKETPLHQACLKGWHQMVEILIRSGAQVDMRDHYQETALYYSCCMGFTKCVSILLNSGANPRIAGREGEPIHVATSDEVRQLLKLKLGNSGEISRADAWEELSSENGKVYFYNTSTGERTWVIQGEEGLLKRKGSRVDKRRSWESSPSNLDKDLRAAKSLYNVSENADTSSAARGQRSNPPRPNPGCHR
eukprot:TRINITY_DN8570_c0_g2_i3.p1 TRINITY_DN8570_c0_g2~~TRINITY_DN8570_c0_g2_i3.p1  ORF type:complete len:1178 (+),score=379.21 TRINITY_DN8570_c0_g2_i3:222-3755(+)